MESEYETDFIPLEPVHVEIVSTLIDRTQIPVPLVIIDDESPLFFDERYENAVISMEDDDVATEPLIGKVLDLERVEDNVFSVKIAIVDEDGDVPEEPEYELFISGQYLQIGLTAAFFLGGGLAPSLFLASESDASDYFVDDDDAVQQTRVLNISELPIHIQFPAAIDEGEMFRRFNQILNEASEEVLESASNSVGLRNFASVPFQVHQDDVDQIRADIIEILSGLAKGEVDALLKLYKYIDVINASYQKIDIDKVDHSEVTLEERNAMVFSNFMGHAFEQTRPTKIIINAESDDISDGIIQFENLFTIQDKDLSDSFDAILTEENATQFSPINLYSSDEEKLDYLSRPSNFHPLRRHLALLESRLNVDLIYSRDWNDFTGKFDEGELELSRGELMTIHAVIIVQRLLLLTDTVEDPKNGITEEAVLISSLFQALALPNEDPAWALGEGLKRLGNSATDSFLYREFVNIASDDDDDKQDFMKGPFAYLLHIFGHQLLSEEWSKESMLLALEDLPEMRVFVSNIFDSLAQHELNSQNNDDDEDDDESDGYCPVIEALDTTLENGAKYQALSSQAGDGIRILAELNAYRNLAHSDDETKQLKDSIKKYVEKFTREFK